MKFLRRPVLPLILLVPLTVSGLGNGAGWSADTTEGPSQRLTRIPSRPRTAITGSRFAQRTARMTGPARQRAALAELRRGNVPQFLRNLKPVRLSFETAAGESVTAVLWVTPDYLAIGSDRDFLRIPLTYPSAITIAREFGCLLPTPRMVDAIYEQAECKLEPQPLPPGPRMRSSQYYLQHQRKIESRRRCSLGLLVSGHKKDIVLSNRLHEKSGRIAIYGWHRQEGDPIQPLSIVHGARYADYSHGVRLVSQTVWINGQPRSLLEVLEDPDLAPFLTGEGPLSHTKVLMGMPR